MLGENKCCHEDKLVLKISHLMIEIQILLSRVPQFDKFAVTIYNPMQGLKCYFPQNIVGPVAYKK